MLSGTSSSMRDPHHHHRHHHNEQLSDRHSALRAFLLLLALSLHSLFEGLALGLLKTNDVIISIFSALIVCASSCQVVYKPNGLHIIQRANHQSKNLSKNQLIDQHVNLQINQSAKHIGLQTNQSASQLICKPINLQTNQSIRNLKNIQTNHMQNNLHTDQSAN